MKSNRLCGQKEYDGKNTPITLQPVSVFTRFAPTDFYIRKPQNILIGKRFGLYKEVFAEQWPILTSINRSIRNHRRILPKSDYFSCYPMDFSIHIIIFSLFTTVNINCCFEQNLGQNFCYCVDKLY